MVDFFRVATCPGGKVAVELVNDAGIVHCGHVLSKPEALALSMRLRVVVADISVEERLARPYRACRARRVGAR